MPDRDPHGIIYRIVDASANRAFEGLRTIEEYARLGLEDRGLTESLKTIRHELQETLAGIDAGKLWQCRSVPSDCGTEISTPAEMHRPDLHAILASAASRTQQALRCLEEYLKPVSQAAAGRIEQLRYRTYTVAAGVLLSESKQQRLKSAKLYLLLSLGGDVEAFLPRVEAFFRAGVDLIQLRDKGADDATLYRAAKGASAIARQAGKWFVVNDRADIAAASGAQGIHVGQDELPMEAVRRVVGPEMLIGVSTHSLDQVREAVRAGADYIGCGPTFPSQTKQFAEFAGTEFLRQAVETTSLPAYAIGGIDLQNLDQVLATGIHGVAVAGGISGQPDPLAAASELRRRLGA